MLFMGGSVLFALGALPPYALWVDPTVVAVTFVIGAVLFTSAAYGQFRQVVAPANGRVMDAETSTAQWLGRDEEWWAAVVQLAGTLLFNVSTTAALLDGLSTRQVDRLVWAPDVYGSIAFLVASHLGWRIACHARPLGKDGRDRSACRIALLNYAGSVFFMASALGALVLPTTGDVVSPAVVTTGTFLGAMCFLIGAHGLLRSPLTPRG